MKRKGQKSTLYPKTSTRVYLLMSIFTIKNKKIVSYTHAMLELDYE